MTSVFPRLLALVPCLSTLVFLAGCEPITIGTDHPVTVSPAPRPLCPFKLVPPLDLPVALRATNYGGGSCLHAAFQDVLRWQHQERLAAYWRANYGGGAEVQDIARICDRLGIDFAYTKTGDVAFLDWCSKTRRGAAVFWSEGTHAVTFCGFVGGEAVIVDNNRPRRLQRMPREQFLRLWRQSGGAAVTAVYAPSAPRPWI